MDVNYLDRRDYFTMYIFKCIPKRQVVPEMRQFVFVDYTSVKLKNNKSFLLLQQKHPIYEKMLFPSPGENNYC